MSNESNQGGSYILDPKTGKEVLSHKTKSMQEAANEKRAAKQKKTVKSNKKQPVQSKATNSKVNSNA